MSHPRRTVPWLMAATLASRSRRRRRPAGCGRGRLPRRLHGHQPVAGRLRRRRHDHQPRRRRQRLDPHLVVRRRADRHPGLERGDLAERRPGDRDRTSRYNGAHRDGREHVVRLQRHVDGQQPGRRRRSRSTAPPAPAARRHRRRSPPRPPRPAPRPPRRTPPARRRPPRRTTPPAGAWQVEKLDRGLISVRSGSGNLVQLAAARHRAGEHGVQRLPRRHQGQRRADHRLDELPRLRGVRRRAATRSARWSNGAEQAASATSLTFGNGYLDVPIPTPERAATSANDASVGDLDGDGQLEIVLKWDPTNAKDNSQSGVTGNVYIDAYKLERHPAVADRPGPQHPRRRALHAVPGVRLRRRRQGRGRDEDRRRHPSTAPAR